MNEGIFSENFTFVFDEKLTDIFGAEFPSTEKGFPSPKSLVPEIDLPESIPPSLPSIDLPVDEFEFALPEQAADKAVAVMPNGNFNGAEIEMTSAIATDVKPLAKKPEGTPGGPPGGNDGNDGGDTGADPVLSATYISGLSDDADNDYYNIQIDFFGTWDDALMDAFAQAADFLSTVIMTGLADDDQAWYTFQDPLGSDNYFTVDDILIEAYLPEIDGPGKILGQAGPYSMRSAGTADEFTTVVGLMQFDVDDANLLSDVGNWDAVVLHEMLHVLGLGTLWDNWAVTDTVVVDDQGTRRPNDDVVSDVYTGTEGLNFYLTEKNESMPDELLIEMDGGAGTAGGHWDDETYATELMTGYLYPDDPYIYLADWTLASLADGGYDVDLASLAKTTGGDNALAEGIDLESAELANSIVIVDQTLIA